MAAPPSPRPPNAQSGGGDAPLSLFLETDLGTRLALLVAPDTTVRRLKSQVAAEHAVAFPDIGPVAVKSFQVHRKGSLYQLSESMTVTRAFPRLKAEYFLHVKMAEAAVAMRCFQGTPEINGRRTSEGHVGINVAKHVRELPAATPEVAIDGLTHGHGVPDILLSPSSQLDTETKNEANKNLLCLASLASLASDADVAKSSKQTNISYVMETDAKEDFLHSNRGCDIDGDVSDNKQIRIEDMLGQGHAVDDIYLGNERKKAKRTDSAHTSTRDPRITNESNIIDTNKSIRAPLETNPAHGEHSNTSFLQEVNDITPEGSLRKETLSTVEKKKKRKRRELAPSEAVSGQEGIKLQSGAVGLSESGADAYEVDLTKRDGSEARPSVLRLPSEPCNERQGGNHVQFVNNAQAHTDVTSKQGNFDHVHNGDSIPSIEDAINSTAEGSASGGKIAEGSSGPWDGGEKHKETEQHKYNDSHEGDVTAVSNMEKDGKLIDALEEKPTNNNIKKRKKVKKVSTVGIASTDSAGDKEILGHTENAGKTDDVYAEREILQAPFVGSISANVQERNSNVIENPNGDGKRKKKKRCKSESLKVNDPNQDQTKSSEHVTNGSLIHNTNSALQDAKQTTQGSVEGLKVNGNKFGESLDVAAAIDEVLADLKSRDNLSEELSENIEKEQINLDNNMNALDLAASTGNEVGNYTALPPKYPEAIDSDAPSRSPSHKKSKGKQLNRLSATIDSSHHSFRMNEEDADTKSKESDTLRFSAKTSDLKDVFTGDFVDQDDDKTKSTKRQRKKVKKVPTDKTTQYLDEQVNQVARDDMEGVNASIQTDLVQAGSAIDTVKVDTRLKESDTLRFSGKTSVLKDVSTGDIMEQDDDKNKSTKKKRKKVPKDKTTRSFDEQVNQVAREDMEGVNASIQADLIQGGSVNDTAREAVAKVRQKGKKASKSQIPKVQEANHSTHTAKDSQDENAIGITGTHDDEHASGYPKEFPGVQKESATLKLSSPNARKERKKHLKTELRNRDSSMERDPDPSADMVRCSAEKDLVSPKNSADAFEANHCIKAHPASDKINFVDYFSLGKMNDRLISAENIQNNEDEIMEAKNTKSNSGSTEPKEFQKSTSPKKASVSNLVKSFAMSPGASSDSTEGTPQLANRFRLAVRKVPKKGSGAVFNGAITKDEKAAMETPLGNSSTSANSGVSSMVHGESDVSDDDGALSPKSLRGLQISSILRGSSSYKKVKQKQAEMLDDDTVVPDSQPTDDP